MTAERSFARSGPQSDLIRALPKVELHCHLLGTIRKQTMCEIARENSARTTIEEIEAFYVRGAKPVGVLRIFRELEAHILCKPADLYRIAYEYIQSLAIHNVRHAEVFWNPTGSLLHTPHPYDVLQAAVVDGLADAERDLGISSVLIPSIDREASSRLANEMVELMIAHRDDRVRGIGVDYRENERPPELFVEAYRMAREAGFKTTAHAGEFGMPWPNVKTAVDDLKIDRLDHAYTVLENPELLARLVDSGMVVTVVPSNSYYLRTLEPDDWSEAHPIRHMGPAGLRIHPNTDDPSFHLINPTECWESMIADFGYQWADLRAFMLNGIEGAWVDDDTKRAWTRAWTREFDASSGEMNDTQFN